MGGGETRTLAFLGLKLLCFPLSSLLVAGCTLEDYRSHHKKIFHLIEDVTKETGSYK